MLIQINANVYDAYYSSRYVGYGKIKCLCCGEILISKFRHDFVKCHCENGAFVDGGNAYTRVGAKDLSKVQNINAYRNPPSLP